MKNNKHGLSIRGDSCYCPLSFALDSYWNCEINCLHCFFRRLNRTWGEELRPINPEALRRKLESGLKNKSPKSPLSYAIKNKKTIRFGNKSDPFQPIEKKLRISKEVLKVFIDLNWTFVIQTKNTELLMEYKNLLRLAAEKGLLWVMPIISPGYTKDWIVFERKKTTPPIDRLRHLKVLSKFEGINIGVNGEPFIPGYHTIKDFKNIIDILKSFGIKSYNTYNLHMNDLVVKNLIGIGLDVEKIWTMNQDKYWYPILQKLLTIARKKDIILGCPDFVNSGWDWVEETNTCCGLNVVRPTLFNTHNWKKMKKAKVDDEKILKATWDGVGNYEEGILVLKGNSTYKYTLKDIKP